MYNSAYFSGRYQIIKKIGAGGMSSVYLCVDKNINKRWAVKQLSEAFNLKGEAGHTDLSLLNSEIHLLKSLDYYMFPAIHDAFFENNRLSIVTDYIEGQTMSSYLKENGPLPVRVALSYFEELLKALDYLHNLSPPILYLDMKTSNIMIRPDGEIKLIDFGIAGSILLKSKSMGSVGYSPPEQYVEGEVLSEKSDVFALAMTLYEMLTGKRPDGNLITQRELIRKSKGIPKRIRELMLKCCEAEMDKRPSVHETLSFLHRKDVYEKGLIPVSVMTCIIGLIFTLTLWKALSFYRNYKYDRYEREMLYSVSEYMDEGEYTAEAVSRICGYIDGHFLDSKASEKYTYGVARFYFEDQKDYEKAGIYFKRLDREKYPEITGYIDICEQMCTFDGNEQMLINLLKEEINEQEKKE